MKIILLSEHFWPTAKVAAVRVTAFAECLARAGHSIIVCVRYCPEKHDPAAFSERFGPSVQLVVLAHTRAEQKAGNIAKRSTMMRLLGWAGLLPPARRRNFWVSDMPSDSIARLVEQESIDVLLSSAPPHDAHVPILRLFRQGGIKLPWIADMRDGFLSDERFRPKGIERIFMGYFRKQEADIYRHASAVTHAIREDYDHACKHYPRANSHVIENGFPNRMLADVKRHQDHRNDVPVLASFGTIGPECIRVLISCSARLLEAGMVHEIRLFGSDAISVDLAALSQIEAEHRVSYKGPLQHEAALSQMAMSDVLICGLSRSKMRGLPLSSKVFEYLACAKPIILINPSIPDRRNSSQFSWIRTALDTEPDRVLAALQDALSGNIVVDQKKYAEFIRQYSREAQAKELEKLVLSARANADESS